MKKLAGKKILVVDDEQLLREVLTEFLSLEGASVIEAENGTVGFQKLEKIKFDIIISDVQMPDGDGLSLLLRIKNDLSYKPLVFLYSGNADTTSREKAQELGATAYFLKPFRMRELIDVMASHVAA